MIEFGDVCWSKVGKDYHCTPLFLTCWDGMIVVLDFYVNVLLAWFSLTVSECSTTPSKPHSALTGTDLSNSKYKKLFGEKGKQVRNWKLTTLLVFRD